MTLEDRVVIRVQCANALEPHLVEKALSWLLIHEVMACPYCDSLINLRGDRNGALIREIAESCRHLAEQTAHLRR